jgi:hypothetical protein
VSARCALLVAVAVVTSGCGGGDGVTVRDARGDVTDSDYQVVEGRSDVDVLEVRLRRTSEGLRITATFAAPPITARGIVFNGYTARGPEGKALFLGEAALGRDGGTAGTLGVGTRDLTLPVDVEDDGRTVSIVIPERALAGVHYLRLWGLSLRPRVGYDAVAANGEVRTPDPVRLP